jgi:hypothetical protein
VHLARVGAWRQRCKGSQHNVLVRWGCEGGGGGNEKGEHGAHKQSRDVFRLCVCDYEGVSGGRVVSEVQLGQDHSRVHAPSSPYLPSPLAPHGTVGVARVCVGGCARHRAKDERDERRGNMPVDLFRVEHGEDLSMPRIYLVHRPPLRAVTPCPTRHGGGVARAGVRAPGLAHFGDAWGDVGGGGAPDLLRQNTRSCAPHTRAHMGPSPSPHSSNTVPVYPTPHRTRLTRLPVECCRPLFNHMLPSICEYPHAPIATKHAIVCPSLLR